ncbi:MAG TPA: bifunctional diaminohydroxyphosphoribosylaminopyrimidine deaminase/5-amino-6-(5-phosphoribosylamino)uracil reductase RibD [Dehalococcoidia bacterium]|jgi:diaminohydroxyphosphoribosylaminopyrimidine deaminase/5-amino-6-(5-phosphoribosylamino)uracil reductase|nr:bifunctional diaminohydroxyphosphoribosylaminopyrimidine deaminase/5-amino-6-(5-phosphoribosylamino)uracil reductase RibD [Dehalococcoidia bacterium]MDP6274142.1 bifunctional diaminohydroxyphosphoribosylaminopyrimidine deaminase/5-amino-6-(5-phosphoribosylamino)uracil reductase RibD [Dehalococcoidia bacterium]MDP7159813.1 bifunctional diaminohydroxyphosphoribosylaminopyrimidine deaminase/5-amino-6-(5-phosphoribosylamino)uracil reductase RibD [Dehalococcoidia bacterium]MDP7213782.1 bifunctiona|tara:strand:- start:13443 stop:14552 length:1110 start_codon:yes stop_codon:yes gene_type:complete
MTTFGTADHRRYMERAIELGRAGLGEVSPRPSVGAVVVRDGEVVGEGRTTPIPGPHAEVIAIQQAGEQARGATVYTTLEPCSHTEYTGPCADALIAAGVDRVVCPVGDPDPRVDGEGFRKLRDAGIQVVIPLEGDLIEGAMVSLEGFLHHIATGRPFLTVKFAASLDGRIATRIGDSQWITSEAARERSHLMRAESDAVITGIGTVLADDPRLTARLEGLSGRPRLRVIVDSDGRMPPGAALLGEPGDVLWVRGDGCESTIDAPNLEAVELPRSETGGIDFANLLEHLGERGCVNVMLEAGAGLTGAVIDAGHAGKIAAFIAPLIIGGVGALPAVGGIGVAEVASALKLDRVRVEQIGPDILVTGYTGQ